LGVGVPLFGGGGLLFGLFYGAAFVCSGNGAAELEVVGGGVALVGAPD